MSEAEKLFGAEHVKRYREPRWRRWSTSERGLDALASDHGPAARGEEQPTTPLTCAK